MKTFFSAAIVLLGALAGAPGWVTAGDLSSAGDKVQDSTSTKSKPGSSKGPIVHLMKTDTRFHSLNCPRLSRSHRSLPLDDAMRAGFGPCPRCSSDILKKTSYRPVDRNIRRRLSRRALDRTSQGPPYVIVIGPRHRTVQSFPFFR